MIVYKDNSDKLRREFLHLDARLQTIVYFMSAYCAERYNLNVVITSIYRTQDEQDAIYGHRPNYKDNPWKSVHQVWRGVDLRSVSFNKHQRTEIVDELNSRFFYSDKHKTCLSHDIGLGSHFHLQVPHRGGREYFI